MVCEQQTHLLRIVCLLASSIVLVHSATVTATFHCIEAIIEKDVLPEQQPESSSTSLLVSERRLGFEAQSGTSIQKPLYKFSHIPRPQCKPGTCSVIEYGQLNSEWHCVAVDQPVIYLPFVMQQAGKCMHFSCIKPVCIYMEKKKLESEPNAVLYWISLLLVHLNLAYRKLGYFFRARNFFCILNFCVLYFRHLAKWKKILRCIIRTQSSRA